MVFESIVVEILNKFLGDYVENLDTSQLKIGIWGGDVVLKNLSLKPSALDELNLPVKTIYGHLGNLTLKIPWKNIYTAPVEVLVENLFLLVNPIQDIVYDEEKEEKWKQEIKQAAISKVELAKKAAREKDNAKVDDSFVEKLTAQIVKNVQIFIKNIHLRYEDRITKPEHPFSIGISLHTLELHTTDESCDSYILPQASSPVFYKKMTLDGLSVYWNVNTKLFMDNSSLGGEEILKDFVKGISKKSQTIHDYMYILGPINSEAKLQINSKPDLMDYITPKIYLSLILEELLINLSRAQYQDSIALVHTFDRMARSAQYRKYRPNLKQYKGHYSIWWKFAITCILEEEVKRKFRNWDWNVMKNHMSLRKEYQRIYRIKMTQKPNQQIINELTELEKQLDAFNIILLRQKVENEIEREGRIVAEQRSSRKGWFSGWFSSEKEVDTNEDKSDLAKQFEKAMTEEEKQKLYMAIDYHESATPESYPTTFVANRMEFTLQALKIVIQDDHHTSFKIPKAPIVTVLCVEFDDVLLAVQQRPAARAFALSVQLRSFRTLGLMQKNITPKLIQSKLPANKLESEVFLNILYEMNPEDDNYDQRLHINLKPLKIVYDAQTVIRILDVFTPEKDITSVKDQIQLAANLKLEEMKEKSAMSLQYAIEKSIRLDLKIDLMAPYLIIPFGGFYTKNELSLIVNLGRISITSAMRGEESYNIKKMLASGQTKDEVLNQVMAQCYDRFSVCLSDVQILALRQGEKWSPKLDNLHETVDGHILEPTCFYVDLFKCVIEDDPRLPKMKIDGNLPDITIRIREKRLMEVLSLLVGLPLPQTTTVEEVEPLVKEDTFSIHDSAASLRQKLESFNTTMRKYRRPTDTKIDEVDVTDTSLIDFNNVETNFTWKRLTICIQRDQTDAASIEAFISDLELKLVQRTYSSELSAKLGNIKLTQSYENSVVPTISTPLAENNQAQYLLSCKLLMAERDSPLFDNSYNSTVVSVEIDFTKLYVVAHLEAILSTIQWVTDIQNHITQLVKTEENQKQQGVQPKISKSRKASTSSNISSNDLRRKKLKPKSTLTAIVEDHLAKSSDQAETKSKKHSSEVTELKLLVKLDTIQICLQTASRALAALDIDGFTTSVVLKKSSTEIETILRSITVGDLNPETMYHKVAYIAQGNDALKIRMRLNNEEYKSKNLSDFDALIEVKMSSLQCVFINEFVMDVLEFVDNFQSSKQKFLEASAAAVASATKNMQQVYQSSAKIFFNIHAEAPVIIFPMNNRSDEVFIIDFGALSVKNKLTKLPVVTGHVPLIDEIDVNLNSMKVVRTNYDKTKFEFLILEPINYTLIIKRNLSASWFTEKPALDINGSFNPIHITIRSTDYKFLMRALDENIGARSPEKINYSSTASVMESVEDIDQAITSEVIIECSDEPETKITTSMQFTMALESVEINLLSESIGNKQDVGLARITLSFLCVKGFMLTNSDLHVHAWLSDCRLDDMRPSKKNNKVTRYMRRKTLTDSSGSNLLSYAAQDDISVPDTAASISNDANKKSMIDVNFEKKNGRTFVNTKISSFILILNMDHITRIQEFFMPDLDTPKNAPAKDRSKQRPNASQQYAVGENEYTDFTSSVTNCFVVIEKPDIILVENLDDINTNAVILNNEAKLQIQISEDGRLGIAGTLNNLQLYTCCYNPEKRNQTTSLILYPVVVELTGSKADGTNLHLDVNVSKIKITITAGTIELLTKICTSLIPNAASEDSENELNSKDLTDVWQQRPIREEYWFLQTEEGVDIAAMDLTYFERENISKREDVFVISAPCINVILEAGVGKKTIPLLALQSSMQGTVTKSTNSILFDSSVSLEVAYYNSRLALWEPIIEPVIRSSGISEPVYEPWQMQFLVQTFNCDTADNWSNEVDCGMTSDVTAISGTIKSHTYTESTLKQPDFSLLMKSEERMEITMTKTGLEAIKTILYSFNEAVGLKTSCKLSILNNPNYSFYSLTNDLGIDVILDVKEDDLFRLVKGDLSDVDNCNGIGSSTVKCGETVNLIIKKRLCEDDENIVNHNACLITTLNSVSDKAHFLRVQVPDKNKELMLPVARADKRFFSLKSSQPTRNSDSLSELCGLVSEVEIVDGGFVTTLRSVVRVYNHLTVQVHVFNMKTGKNKNEVTEVGVIPPCQYLNIPVQVVYSANSPLYFAPDEYSVSTQPFNWRNLQQSVSISSQIHCNSKNVEKKDPFFIRVIGEMEQIYHENTNSYTIVSTVYNIHLRSIFIFKNFLPMNVTCQLQGIDDEYVVEPGMRIFVPTVEPDNSTIMIKLENYLGLNWSCKKIVKSDTPTFSIWVFNAQAKNRTVTLNLGVWCSSEEGSMIYALYCPFWMINKTELDLFYKGVDDDGLVIEHPYDYEKPILFSFKEKSFFGKKKACVRVNDGSWSEKLSVDAAGSSGSAICLTNNVQYQLGVYVKLNSNTLTKQVIFSPFFTIANNCQFGVEFREDKMENAEWCKILPEKCIPFWPTVQDDKNRTIELRICGTSEVTTSFSYMNFKTYPLMLLNKYGGLVADVQVTEGGVYIGISPFQAKVAPALIINDTDSPMQLAEVDLNVKNLDNVRETENMALRCLQNNSNIQFSQLEAKKELLFNWSCNNFETPVLLINRSPSPIDLRKDGIGECTGNDKDSKKYWISFLNGMQRTVLITTNKHILKEIEAVGDFEHIQKEINFSLEGIGFSVVNDITKNELLYFSIFSSGISWETQKKIRKRFKPVSDLLNEKLEKAYLTYCNKLRTSSLYEEVDSIVEIDIGKEDKVVVNFAEGLILKPQYGNLRRAYNSGLWMQVRSSECYQQIHAKIHRLQVDNQMYDCVFPVVFFPIPPPKSVATNDDLITGHSKPFAELSIVQRVNEGSNVRQYKYFKVLIQEFHVKVDIGFINSLVKFFEADRITYEEEVAQFKADEALLSESLCHHITSVTSQDFYDLLHFSPLKIHFSFSLAGESSNSGSAQQGLPILNLLTQSIGVTLTDFNDIVFRLAYFERKYKFYSQAQLNLEVRTHYTGQLVKQLYVLVLGLDVLGNPFGLVTGLKQGVEDFFYEPFQGAIQGPSEFAEGVMLGVRSLFGHTVGGAAGAVGRITGVMGKGIAALTLDEDYQKKRRQRLAQQQQSIKDGGRELFMGVVEGVGGVISKPISGAREEGVEGFVKGVGKGVVGLFMRPASGVVDFASGTVDAVRRVATCSEEVRRYRLPRFIKENRQVVPYFEKEAQGYKYLLDIEKGRYTKTDLYLFHVSMGSCSNPDKEILLLTDKRIMYLMKGGDIFADNNMKMEWQYTWKEVRPDDAVGETEDGIYIRLNTSETRRPTSGFGAIGNIFKKVDKGKILKIPNEQVRLWLLKTIKELVAKANKRS